MIKFFHHIKGYFNKHPLRFALIASSLFLLLAVLFSKGYGMHDDHYLVIENSQSWADGKDYDNWLPWNNTASSPKGHSFFYCGLHFLFFKFCNLIGFTDPQGKMYIVRFLHALLSLFTIYFGFKISYKLANVKTAGLIALLLGLYWFVPFLSVRNLVEIVCIPFLMYGIWRIINCENNSIKHTPWYWILTGIIFGIAINLRLQSILFVAGVGLVLLIQKKWIISAWFAFGVFLSLSLIQIPIDLLFWGYPFAELAEYIRYNATHSQDYITQGWYTYLILIFGILIPPVSIFIILGFFRITKNSLVIFIPTLLFFLFHSYFPNKQERFIFPVIPFIIMLGLIGWDYIISRSLFWQKRKRFIKYSWIFFWCLNLGTLPVISTVYSKRSRVESMSFLSKYNSHRKYIIEDTNTDDVKILPLYYAKNWNYPILMSNKVSLDSLQCLLHNFDTASLPQYILFCGSENLEKRINNVKTLFPALSYLETIEPSFIDKLIYTINPRNRNQQIFIYKLNQVNYYGN